MNKVLVGVIYLHAFLKYFLHSVSIDFFFLPISGNTSLRFVTQLYSATTESSLRRHQNPP